MRCSCFLLRSFGNSPRRLLVVMLLCMFFNDGARRSCEFHSQGAARRGEARRSALTFIEFFQSALTFIRKMYIYTPKSKINTVGVYIFTCFPYAFSLPYQLHLAEKPNALQNVEISTILSFCFITLPLCIFYL